MADWPYSTTAWKNLRALKLRTTPLCEPCSRRGVLIVANTVDHRVSIANGGEPFPALDGLTSMCPACHNAKTKAVDVPGGSGVAFPGCDVSGMPIDPDHPAYAQGYTPLKDQRLGRRDRLGLRSRTKFRPRGGR